MSVALVGSPVAFIRSAHLLIYYHAHPSSLLFLPRLSLPCMAAYLNWRSVAAGSLGKRFLHQIRAASPLPAFSVAFPVISYRSRAVHDSSYDKNVDEHVRPSVVPDYVINASSSDKYWGPHPTTGVFGPADDGSALVAGSSAKLVGGPASGPSEVETTVWFRHQEGVDKAPYA